jgi:hypothetical protein
MSEIPIEIDPAGHLPANADPASPCVLRTTADDRTLKPTPDFRNTRDPKGNALANFGAAYCFWGLLFV